MSTTLHSATVIAVTPGHRLAPEIAIAAQRAKALGILDLGHGHGAAETGAALHQLRQGSAAFNAGGSWGARCDLLERDAGTLTELLTPSLAPQAAHLAVPWRLPLLVLAGVRPEQLAEARALAGQMAGQVLLEVRGLDAALAAEAAGYDGLILKGYEAGGRVSPRSSFILLQEVAGQLRLPYWIQGGIGLHSAAAAALAGATGVVLCDQLWLAVEGPFSSGQARRALLHLDGSETVLAGAGEVQYRVFGRSGRPRLRQIDTALAKGEPWQALLAEGLADRDDGLIAVGQDIAFAAPLAQRYGTVGRIVTAIGASMDARLQQAAAQAALAPDGALAAAHGTRYAVAQGPMTRVSDVAPFALAVAEGGALPFLALAVMRGPQVRAMMEQTRDAIGDLPWGVGILGFMPLALRQEQLEVIRELRPPFAVIAGGRPSQARELEALGIVTYLHVPSPGLLRGFLAEGARHFVFEGSECGGHTGPRSSFALWEQAIELLLAADFKDPQEVQVMFAGGIHDALSAAMVAALAAPLVARGMKIGVWMGTAYLFTEEIVGSGAVVAEFQQQAIACTETALLQSGVGVYTRCASTPFCAEFEQARQELLLLGRSEEETLLALEQMNIGRLRIAAKGITRNTEPDAAERYVRVEPDDQVREGVYMLGDVARLRERSCTIAELHQGVSADAVALLARQLRPAPDATPRRPAEEDIAIVGMACLFPGAQNLREYWENIVQGVDSVREVSAERWSAQQMFDPRRGTPDKVYAKWGGFLDDIAFDPQPYGIAPASLASIEPMQLLALEVARQALADAGFDRRPFPRERTASIFAVGGMADLSSYYNFRTLLPLYLDKLNGLAPEARRHIVDTLNRDALPQWTEDSFPGILGNVVAGRIANRLDLGGTNFTVDAACAASLAALDVGIKQLRNRDADVALAGGIDCTNGAIGFMCFAQTHALSPRGRSHPFDHSADGIAISEGVGAVVLKRLGDAERDGDRIYALIKGIGSSSDGRNRSLTAPHPAGQVLAVRRAYQDAGLEPSCVSLIEAHGTGTALGDRSEIEALGAAFGQHGMARQSCALGSVKSMIGHTKVAAGMAGLIKAALALQHRVLPPTIGVEQPTAAIDFGSSPFYLNTEARPWLRHGAAGARHCGVSAFGFGGTNFHSVLAEYTGAYRSADALSLAPREAEIFIFAGATRDEIAGSVQHLLNMLQYARRQDLAQLAYALYREQHVLRRANGGQPCRLTLLASGVEDLQQKLLRVLQLLPDHAEIRQPPALYYRESASGIGQVAFLFPGQGSQRVNMLRDLVLAVPALHANFEQADAAPGQAVADRIYPLPVFSEAEREAQQRALNATEVAQPALGMAGMAAFQLLSAYGLAPDCTAGHSYGELVALCAAGAIGQQDLLRLSLARGRLAAAAPAGAMAVLDGNGEQVGAAIARHGLAVSIANFNAPGQTIVAGSAEAIDAALPAFGGEGMRVRRLPVSAAFHCALMDGLREPLAAELDAVEFRAPRVPVYSNTTAAPHPADPAQLRQVLARHVAEPVRFVEQVEAMYQDGARVFIECGPGLVLSGLVDAILGQRPHTTLALDAPGRAGWLQLAQLLTQAMSIGLPLDLTPWFAGRGLDESTLEQVAAAAERRAIPAPLAWRVNGGRALPWKGAPKLRAAISAATAAAPMPPLATASAAEAVATAPRPAAVAIATPPAAPPALHHSMPRRPAAPRPLYPAHYRRSSMKAEEFLPPEPPAAPSAQLAQMQHSFDRLLDLQCEQQFSLRHFLDLQAQMAGISQECVPAAAPWLSQSGQSMQSAQPMQQPAQPAIMPPPPPPRAIPPTPPPPPAAPPATMLAAGPQAPVLPPQVAAAIASAPTGIAAAGDQAAASGAGLAVASADEFKAELLQAVSERTGYPTDMLDLDAHMEADLGIDSIKRIEIFSGLTTRYNLIGERDEEAVIAELSGYKTLNEIVNWYAQSQRPAAPEAEAMGGSLPKKAPAPLSPQSETAEPAASANADAADPVLCYVVKASPAPLGASEGSLEFPRTFPVLLAGPESAVSAALRELFEQQGYQVQQLIPGAATQRLDAQRCEVDFSSAETVAAWRALAPPDAPPAGVLVNLMAEARALFLLLKVLEPDLKASATGGAGRLINLTRLDGQFGLSRSRELAAASAGTLGLAKSAAREWPAVQVKCLDAAPELAPQRVALQVLGELRSPDPAVEIGFTDAGRWRIELHPDAPARQALDGLRLEQGAVLLVTGGAYGITADISCALAARYQPRMVLLGRSEPPGEEAEATRGVADAALQQALLKQMREGDPAVTPAKVNGALKRVLRERQIRRNLAAMRSSGAAVEYHCIDVRDGAQLAALLDQVYLRHGRIDGVLHGAGVIGDKLIGDKTPASFDAVFDTKVLPALVLADKLRPDSLKFIAFFSSVAGRFGNVGQCDYSAANEVLNKLADSLSVRWPRVHALSINWGPWDAGMVDAGLRKLYAARAIQPIAVAEGRRHFMQELERGAAGAPELVITSSMRQIAALRAAR